MINYYQPFLLPFLTYKPYRRIHGMRRSYFLSFEDGLWVLLKKRKIPKGSCILIPDFYCVDVVDNIRSHGYMPIAYPLDDQFTISDHNLERHIRTHKPKVLIIFHACGITRISRKRIEKFCASYPDILFVEDAVHMLVNPQNMLLTHSNHYLMDSLRKVSPLPGSFLYQNTASPHIHPDTIRREWKYALSVHVTFIFFRAVFILGTLLHNAQIIRYAHEKTLKIHDDIVGDSDGGYMGSAMIPHIHTFINFGKIQHLKYTQTTLYEKYMAGLLKKSPLWYRFRIPEKQKKDLHVYPIGLKKGNMSDIFSRIESYLHSQGVIVWFKFPESEWSKTRGVLFLPLGFHIKPKHIVYIMNILKSAV